MSDFELVIQLVAMVGFFGTVIYVFRSILKHSRLKMETKNKALDPDLLVELKQFRAFKERTEKRLQALEHIASTEEEEETSLFLDIDDEPLPSKKEEKNTSRLKNQLKS
jgi:hypothetical protein